MTRCGVISVADYRLYIDFNKSIKLYNMLYIRLLVMFFFGLG